MILSDYFWNSHLARAICILAMFLIKLFQTQGLMSLRHIYAFGADRRDIMNYLRNHVPIGLDAPIVHFGIHAIQYTGNNLQRFDPEAAHFQIQHHSIDVLMNAIENNWSIARACRNICQK